jgi:hypothetical protein
MIATKQQQLTISISTINDTDYFGKGISIYFLEFASLIGLLLYSNLVKKVSLQTLGTYKPRLRLGL